MRIFIFLPLLLSTYLSAQTVDSLRKDSAIHIKYLEDITIVGRSSKMDIQQMPEIVGTSIYAGKKSSLIVLENVMGNVVNNTMRQVVAKVPGIQIWENDGSGIQIGIAARGLSPNRSWEFNVRQNGYDISADPYGYPEAYYNPQLQAVQRIEIVRGHGALQYGPQFGGMVNYILRNGSEMTRNLKWRHSSHWAVMDFSIRTMQSVVKQRRYIITHFLITEAEMDTETTVSFLRMRDLLQ
jgi:Fe(3+) dicitrate transport protein